MMLTPAVLLAITLLLLTIYLLRGKKRRLPPGPLGIPILGNLLSISPNTPHLSLSNLAWKYGPICGLQMGSVYTVLVTDPKIIRQSFAKDSFSGRAPLYLTHGIMKGLGIIASEGELWKDARRFVSGCLKNFGMVKFESPKRDKLEERILKSTNEALMKIEARSSNDLGLDPHHILHHCIGNLMNLLVFGKVYEEDDELWKWLQESQDEGVKLIGVSGPLNFLPFLRHIPYYGNTMKIIIEGQKKTHDVYREILREHRENPKEMTSFLAAFDEEIKQRVINGQNLGSYNDSQCMYLLADIYGAGVDTTLTTLRWFLLFMTAYPEEQAKIQEEMDHVVGYNLPKLKDRPDLPKLEAAIMESQRIRSVVPTGIPHGTTEDTKIECYDVPKGSMIMPLQWAIHMNPSFWPEPEKFKPERFISTDGSLVKPDAFLPFQIGKRMCIGDEFAKMILFLFSASILHQFSLTPAKNQIIDLEGECGITLVPKSQSIIFKRRTIKR